ncbi:MAG: ATP-grasp ribosomal peptide maturase [Pseudonocardiales bacterium]|nr:ATP-grasp ribosomal peptide maturase [Pseudonocardiales bacterium]
MTVLLLARDLNPSADHLVRALTELGVPVFRTDLAAFPQTLSLDARLGPSGWEGVLATEHRELRLKDIRSVWYRHPSHFVLPAGMSSTERRHAAAEARCGLSGVLSSLDVLWVNHPARESDAVKPRQLDVARRCGLSVPDSQVTNRPDGVRRFARDLGGALVCKTLGGALRAESGRLQMAYTRRLDVTELGDLAGVDTTLHFFQPFVSKSFEARVTVVGHRIFAAAIHAKSEPARVDWRTDYDALDYSIIEPPESVTAGMLAFLKVFGLSFGAFDFAITPSGDWVMFECNPAGQYGWLEEAVGFPITAALADLLANGARRCAAR